MQKIRILDQTAGTSADLDEQIGIVEQLREQVAEPGRPRVLVVDDDAGLRDLIAAFLQKHGFDVDTASDGDGMDVVMARGAFDCIVLDLVMPGEDGLAILRRIGGPSRPPVILLSAMDDITDRIVGLEVGADDYLSKPCNPHELLARIYALLRRSEWDDSRISVMAEQSSACRQFGIWTLDPVRRVLQREGCSETSLTGVEFRTLTFFLDRSGQPLSRDALVEGVNGHFVKPDGRSMDVIVSRLRQKLRPDDTIKTIRNVGYMLVCN